MPSETVRNLGFEAKVTVINAITAVAYTTSSVEVLSAAIDLSGSTYARARFLVVGNHAADATSTGVTMTVKESATSGGSYTAATKSGTFGASTSAGSWVASFKRNPLMPFVKISMTPAGGSGVISATVLALGEGAV